MLSTFLVSLSLALASAGTSIDVPLTGEPLAPSALAALDALPGVDTVIVDGHRLELTVLADAEVSLREVEALVERHSSGTRVDTGQLLIGAHTIFQLDAGVCFRCAEEPIGQTLARRPFVRDWTVVDYQARGRLRFRVEPTDDELRAEAMDVESFEDVILTGRYDGLGAPDLYWSTGGGVAWRPDEQTARREATSSKKPLMIFPTAGT